MRPLPASLRHKCFESDRGELSAPRRTTGFAKAFTVGRVSGVGGRAVWGRIWEYGVQHPDGCVLVLAVAGSILLTIIGFVFVLDVGILAIMFCTESAAVWSLWNRLTGEQRSRRIQKEMPARTVPDESLWRAQSSPQKPGEGKVAFFGVFKPGFQEITTMLGYGSKQQAGRAKRRP
jgi:hypothetical protein